MKERRLIPVDSKLLDELVETLNIWSGPEPWTDEDVVLEGLRQLQDQLVVNKVHKFVSWRERWKVL